MNEGPNKTLWFFIVGLAVLLVAAGWVASTFLGVSVPGHDTTPVSIRVAVAPEAYEAVRAAATQYASQNPKLDSRPIVLEVVSVDGAAALRDMEQARYNAPTVWISEAQWWLAYTQGSQPQPGFVATGSAAPQSIARTYMIWGAFEDRADALQDYGGLSWRAVHDAVLAESTRGPTLVVASPGSSVEGIAALLGATAEYRGSLDLTQADFDRALQDWLRESLDAILNPRMLGSDPARILAEQGRTLADVGFIAEGDWLRQAVAIQNKAKATLTFAYPAQTIVLDFPYAIWAGAASPEQNAALDFRAFLLGTWQARMNEYGLRPPAGPASGGLFARFSSYGIVADPPTSPVAVAPALIRVVRQWASSNAFAP